MKDNITDWALERYRTVYGDKSITKEDIFYYIYAILHHRGYRQRYRKSLAKDLPRIPLAPDFRAFCKAGRKLADVHLNYETGPRYNLGRPMRPIPDQPKKIRFAKKRNPGPGPDAVDDLSTLVMDDILVYDNLPEPAYVVNKRTPIQWFAYKYAFKLDVSSGNTNWPLRGIKGDGVRAIVERLVYVGVESEKIIAGLPTEFKMDDVAPDQANYDRYWEETI